MNIKLEHILPALVDNLWTVDLLSRADEQLASFVALDALDLAGTRIDNADAATVTSAQPDHSALRDAWRYLCERTPWELMAGIHAQRGWGPSRHLQNGMGWARAQANRAFGAALKDGHGHSEHCIVVLQPANPDRPIELYSEALNAAAYRAKLEELWPTPVANPKTVDLCGAVLAPGVTCKVELRGAHKGMCGECFLQLMQKRGSARPGYGKPKELPPPEPEPSANPHHEWRGWATPAWEA